MPTATRAVPTRQPAVARRLVTRAEDVDRAAQAVAGGAVVATAFANFYALVTRADPATVRAVNAFKGRPTAQVGSLTAPPATLADVWDLDALPRGLSRRRVLEVVDALFALGPFGFRGPAAAHVPSHLTSADLGVRTAQLIAPGYSCPSNRFLEHALAACGEGWLYVTSANRSRHLTGEPDSPAHWRAAGLVADFGQQPGFLLVEHKDEGAARRRYPAHLPMSTSVLSFHAVSFRTGDRRPQLTLERHGSLAVEDIRRVLAELGLGLVVGPQATRRLTPRDYQDGT